MLVRGLDSSLVFGTHDPDTIYGDKDSTLAHQDFGQADRIFGYEGGDTIVGDGLEMKGVSHGGDDKIYGDTGTNLSGSSTLPGEGADILIGEIPKRSASPRATSTLYWRIV